MAQQEMPLDGLLLWLDARSGVESSSGVVTRWHNPAFVSGAVLEGDSQFPPKRGHGKIGPHVQFGYENYGTLQPKLPNGVQTVISVHTFGVETATTGRGQFYIIAGSDQGPFHAAQVEICSGHGAWAGGEAFCNGTIRLDGVDAVPVKSVTVKDFVEPRLAVVQCTEPGCINKQGNGMNRIGRDRNCHAYNGNLHELLVYDRQLSADEIETIELYLHQRWFVPVVVTLTLARTDGSDVLITAIGVDGSELLRCELTRDTTIEEIKAKVRAASGIESQLQLLMGTRLIAASEDSTVIGDLVGECGGV